MEERDIDMLVRKYLAERTPVGPGHQETAEYISGTFDRVDAGKRHYIVAANWKMNMSTKETKKFIAEMKGFSIPDNLRVMIFPPYPYLYLFQESLRYDKIAYGAQDVAKEEKGAYTGEVSATMLGDMGCSLTLVGHSERRTYYGETSEIVAQKAKAALEHMLTPIICVGETLDERQSGRYHEVLKAQLDAVNQEIGGRIEECIIAYEPVWAIGTGVIPTMDQIEETHKFIHDTIRSYSTHTEKDVPILYGGSVNEKNVREIAAVQYVGGFLIGGASLKVDSFKEIIRLASESS